MIRLPSRADIMLTLVILAGAACATAGRPNVIVVMTDDQGYGDLGVHGNPVVKTPQLDRLHGESVRLTDFHVAPVCTPTRGQLLTGRDALANGAMTTNAGRALLRREIPTAANIFSANGYRTGQFGKWHLGDNYPYRPHDRGFDKAIYFPASHIGSAPDAWNNDAFDDIYRVNGGLRRFSGYATDVFFDEAMSWMGDKSSRGETFFAYLALSAPHTPHFVPDRYRAPYQQHPMNLASFYGMIANIDENMGRLDAFLERTGLRRNTILVFLTDNGATTGKNIFNAGMRGSKASHYDGGHRVPCFIRWPAGGLAPRNVGELTQVQDILPTLLDLTGVRSPVGVTFDGLSMAPLLRGMADRLPDRTLVVQYSSPNDQGPKNGAAAVLWKKWRLVLDKELYDTAADPGQTNDVAAAHPDVIARMRSSYQRWWSRVEPRVNEISPVTIGSDRENPSVLSPAEWEGADLDTSRQIRQGKRDNGRWNLLVDRPGHYEITLRRWPAESKAALDAEVPKHRPADAKGEPLRFTKGEALPIAEARIEIAGIDERRNTKPGQEAVTFDVDLPRGPTHLKTRFYDAAGAELCGAYYVYVRRL